MLYADLSCQPQVSLHLEPAFKLHRYVKRTMVQGKYHSTIQSHPAIANNALSISDSNKNNTDLRADEKLVIKIKIRNIL